MYIIINIEQILFNLLQYQMFKDVEQGKIVSNKLTPL